MGGRVPGPGGAGADRADRADPLSAVWGTLRAGVQVVGSARHPCTYCTPARNFPWTGGGRVRPVRPVRPPMLMRCGVDDPGLPPFAPDSHPGASTARNLVASTRGRPVPGCAGRRQARTGDETHTPGCLFPTPRLAAYLGAPPGKTRVFVYTPCEDCERRDPGGRAVEERILADRRTKAGRGRRRPRARGGRRAVRVARGLRTVRLRVGAPRAARPGGLAMTARGRPLPGPWRPRQRET